MSVYVSTLDQLLDQIADGNREPIIVGGDLVYVTSDKKHLEQLVTSDEQYVMQPPRLASRGKILDAKRAFLYLGVRREALSYLLEYKGNVSFIADQYLAYGLSQKGKVIVIGGGNNGRGALNLELFVFTDSKIVETQERNVELSGLPLDIATRDILAAYPDHAIHWCDPLGTPPICDLSGNKRFLEVGDAPFKSLIRKRIYAKRQKTEESLGLIPASVLAVLGVAVFLAAVGLRWASITSERSEYKREIMGYESVYSNSAQSLDLLRHRKSFLSSEPEHVNRVKMLDHLLAQVARVEGVLILKLSVYSADDPETTQVLQGSQSTVTDLADFRVEILVPQQEGNSARDQAEPMLAQLNHSTGMSVRLTDHVETSKTVSGIPVKYWQYRLSGSFNAPAQVISDAY